MCNEHCEHMDEAQLEVKRSDVEFKVFKFDSANEESKKAAEASAKAFRASQTDKVWSDVMHTEKMFYVAYNRAGELAAKAVNMAGQFYNLNVDLTAGYMIGTNWASCH